MKFLSNPKRRSRSGPQCSLILSSNITLLWHDARKCLVPRYQVVLERIHLTIVINTSTFVVLKPVPLTVELSPLVVVWLWSPSIVPQLVQPYRYSTSVSQGFYQKKGEIQCVGLMACFHSCTKIWV